MIPIIAAAATTAVSTGIQSAIMKSGNGLIMNRGRRSFNIHPKDNDSLIISSRKFNPREGMGLYLSHHPRGSGLYLRREGSGLIPISPGDHINNFTSTQRELIHKLH